MSRIIATEYVSLDGVVEAPGGGEDYRHAGWTFEFEMSEPRQRFKLEETLESEALLLGRVTYEAFAGVWLVQGLLEHDLVDELRLMVFPVVLGTGKRLFGETTDKKGFRLSGMREVGDGVSVQTFRLHRPATPD